MPRKNGKRSEGAAASPPPLVPAPVSGGQPGNRGGGRRPQWFYERLRELLARPREDQPNRLVIDFAADVVAGAYSAQKKGGATLKDRLFAYKLLIDAGLPKQKLIEAGDSLTNLLVALQQLPPNELSRLASLPREQFGRELPAVITNLRPGE